jgi:hypothetical protein
MIVQLGFIRATADNTIPEHVGFENLQAVHPNIFKHNDAFMTQTYLPILEVSEVNQILK